MQLSPAYSFVMLIVTDDDYMLEKVSKLQLSSNASRSGSNVSELNDTLY